MGEFRHAVKAIVAIAVIVLAGTAGIVAAGRDAAPAPGAPGLRTSALPDGLARTAAPRIRLPDARGGTFDSRTLAGRPYLVTFVYTHCRDVCPVIGEDIAAALRRLGPRARGTAALAISVDPRGDTPAAARRWLATHRLPRQVHYLVGSREELAPVWQDWFLAPEGERRLDSASHAAGIWLVDARGGLRGRWSAGAPVDPGDLAHDLAALR